MNKNNIVINKIICTGLAIAIVLSAFNYEPAKAASNRYVALEKVVVKNPDLDLFINEKSQTIDLARTQNIRVRIKAKDLYNSIDRTSSFKISIYENKGAVRKFISSQQLSIFKGYKRSRVLSISAGEFTSPTKNLEFDIYDTAGNIINTYKTTITAINIESQVSGSTGINIAEANCDGETFGECQIDYLLQRVQFEAKPQRQASTRVVKTNDGLYKVTFPFPRNKFEFLGRKVRRKTKDDLGGGGGGGGGGGSTDFGETLNISTINIGNNLSESQFITYGPNGDLIFNDNLFLDLEGKLGIGVQPPLAWLHVRNGDSIYPSIKIGRGPLTTIPVDGAIEFDGTNLYFTVGTTRNILGAGGGSNGGTIINNNTNVTNNDIIEVYNQGDLFFNQTELTFIDVTEVYNQGNITYNDTFITNNDITEVYNQGNILYNQTFMDFTDVYQTFNNGNITYDNGTVINFVNGSYMQNPVSNGFVLFTDNSYTQINGQLAIPGGTQYQVLTNINGLALWRDPSAVFNGVVSVNQTFNVDNGTYFIDNGTYFETDNNYNVDNGTYNFFNSTVLVDNGYYDYTDTIINNYNGTSNYFNQDMLFEGSIVNFSNTDLLFTNGSRLIIPGGTNGQVLTYVNGVALWRNTTAISNGGTTNYYNGITNYFNQDISYTDTNLDYNNVVENFYDSVANYYNQTELYYNGDTSYFNQSITFTDNIHNYFDTTINTTNNIENHDNLQVTYIDVFEQYFNGISNYYNQSLLYEDSIVNFSNTDVILSNGSRLIIPGGVNGQVLTYVNGVALWRNTTAISNGGTTNYYNGITNYFNQDISYTDTNLDYNNVVENFYDSVANYYNQTELYYNGDTSYFNQSITFTDNIHNYFDTTINTTNNIENHDNLQVTYIDVFEQYFNGISNYYNQSLLYEDSIVNFSNTDVILSNGSRLIIPGGVNGQVLTYVNGVALWRNTTAIANGGTTNYYNGITNYFNQDISYTDTNLDYNNVVENFYDSVANYYNQTELHYNGDTSYFNQSITFTDNIHNYFDTTINTTNNIENHDNLQVTYIDIFEQYFNGISNYYNQSLLYEDSIVNFSNTDVILSNGSRLIIPGGVNGQVLTYVNGVALWRNTTAIANGGTTNYYNGITNYFNQDISYTDTNLDYNNVVENFYDSVANYYNQTELHYNGDTSYFNQSITFTDNIHNYFDTTINTTNNIENHDNLQVTYIDVFEQYFNGISNYYNQSLLYEDSIVNFSNTDVILSNGSRLIIPGGVNGQVLTYVNGVALWRNTTAIANGGTTNYYNGITNYFNQDISYTDTNLDYNNVVENFYDSVANYYNQTELHYNGDTSYFNQSITFTDNIHNYFDTTINTTNNIENHDNLQVTYIDIFEQYFNGISNYYNQSLLYEDSIVNFSNTDVILSNGSRLIIPGGVNGQVLTFVNGQTLWRPSSAGSTEWTDIGNILHPTDLGGNESIVIGGNSIALADIYLSHNGGAMFNKQSGTEDFVMLNADGQEFRIEGANGNVAIRTAGLIGPSTLELSDTTQAVTFSMLPNGAGSGPMLLANTLGLTIDASSSLTINVDAGSRELFVNGDIISVGPTNGNATFNVDGNFSYIGAAAQSVTAAGGINADRSFVRVVGNAGPVTITANPQINVSGTLQDGQILILKGTSNVNTVTVLEGNGISLESGVNFTLQSKDVLQLIYDAVDGEWIEISRSDK